MNPTIPRICPWDSHDDHVKELMDERREIKAMEAERYD